MTQSNSQLISMDLPAVTSTECSRPNPKRQWLMQRLTLGFSKATFLAWGQRIREPILQSRLNFGPSLMKFRLTEAFSRWLILGYITSKLAIQSTWSLTLTSKDRSGAGLLEMMHQNLRSYTQILIKQTDLGGSTSSVNSKVAIKSKQACSTRK